MAWWFTKRRVWRNLTLTGATMEIDGAVIEGCTLHGCTLVYSGGDLPTMNDNTILDARFEMRGAASRTLNLMKFLQESGASGRDEMPSALRH